MQNFVIGLDLGTTNAKAVAVSEDGRILANYQKGYTTISLGSQIEQRVYDWIEAAQDLLRSIVASVKNGHCLGLSISTQGATTAAVDPNGTILGNALTWMDTRAVLEAEEIRSELGEDYVYHTSGWRINPSLDAAKIRFMRRKLGYSNRVKYLSTLEIMNEYFTGNPVIDPTNAAIRQLFNVEKGCWDKKLLNAACIDTCNLCEVQPTGTLIGSIGTKVAHETGLPCGTPVFNGAHDQYCAAIGAGVVCDGDMMLSTGTTWALLGLEKKPLFTPSYISIGKHLEAGLYGAMVSLTCSGASLQWFNDNFLMEDFKQIDDMVEQRMEQIGDLYFFPFLTGANYPIWNNSIRGAFTGITLEHDKFDFARAIMESAVFRVKSTIDDFRQNGMKVKKLRIMGGAAKSNIWTQMVADINQMIVERMDVTDACALGAAIIALIGIGRYLSYAEASAQLTHVDSVFKPRVEVAKYYTNKMNRFNLMERVICSYYKE